jgi:hypothetical protein
MMNDSLTRRGFKQSDVDNCLYSYQQGGEIIYLLTHVDDILAATTNEKTLSELMKDVGKDFEVKCFGDASEYLGIKIERDPDGRFKISQEKFIDTIIETTGQKDARTSKYPVDTGYYKLQGERLCSVCWERLQKFNLFYENIVNFIQRNCNGHILSDGHSRAHHTVT